jgi:prepilin-type N-terminal cleavage/methylation domain-containing protein
MYYSKRKNGFSLIELLVVATIIIVLTTIGIITFQNAGRNARDSKRKTDLETVRQALVLYRSDNTSYPTGVAGANYSAMTSTLGAASYLSQPYPQDPKTGTSGFAYTYTNANAGATFCLCASTMENAANASNPTGCLVVGGTSAYCIVNP